MRASGGASPAFGGARPDPVEGSGNVAVAASHLDEPAGPETPRPGRRRADAASGPPPARSLRRISRGVRQLRHIPVAQLTARARFIALRRCYALAPGLPIQHAHRQAAGTAAAKPLPALPRALIAPEGMVPVEARAAAFARGRFCYLGREADFSEGVRWRDQSASPLWLFNLHYLGALVDLVLTGRVDHARRLLASWVTAFGDRWDAIAWHSYPVSLRLSNLCFAARDAGGFDALGARTLDLAAAHAAFLLAHLEHDLRGNHLLENAVALVCAARSLRGRLARRCDAVARQLLAAEIPEQVQADGGHFELSPMYHSIVLHRLLQARWLLGDGDVLVRETLDPAIGRMASFLRGILCPDGDIPLLGDSVRGFAAPPGQLLDLAAFVAGGDGRPPAGRASFADAGVHVLRGRRIWAIVDAGPVCASYLPGHGQADSLTVEVWCDGACVVGDPGVHEYTGPERAWGRSSRAHSTMTIDDGDTSEVYGSFRVGGRARIAAVAAEPNAVTAALEPFGLPARLTRTVRLGGTTDEALEILDTATGPAGKTVRTRLHLHPAVRLVEGPSANGRRAIVRTAAGLVRIEGQRPLELERGRASRQYGSIEPTTILVQTLTAGAATAGDVRLAKFSIVPLDGAR